MEREGRYKRDREGGNESLDDEAEEVNNTS